MEAAVDSSWSGLPADLLVLIMEKLAVPDYIRFGAVCKAWDSVAKSKTCRPAPQPPWLMYPTDDDDDDDDDDDRRSFFDMASTRVYTMHLPQLRGRECIGTSADGSWVVFIGEDMELGLLHLLTGGRPLRLPPLSTLWNCMGVVTGTDGRPIRYVMRTNHGPESFVVKATPELLLQHFYHKAIVFRPSSSADDTPVVAFIHGFVATVSVARPGDQLAWKSLDTPHCTTDVVFHGGRLCAVDDNGNAAAFELCDPSSLSWSDAQPLGNPMTDFEFLHKYLVPLPGTGSSGDLIHVWRDARFVYDPDTEEAYRTSRVKAFRLDLTKGPWGEWVEVKDLGGYTFFLGHNYSVALSPSEFPWLRRDCIYFTEDCLYTMLRYDHLRLGDRDLGVFSFEGGTWDALPWPGATVNFPSPIWVTPSPL